MKRLNEEGSVLLITISILLILSFVMLELIQANLTWHQSLVLMEKEEKENSLLASGVALAINKLYQTEINYNEVTFQNYNQYTYMIIYTTADIINLDLINIEISMTELKGIKLIIQYDKGRKLITGWNQISVM